MKLDPLLSKAAHQARKGDYEGALKTLRAEEDRYYGSFKYYYLYAVICLYSGAFVDALTNFRLAKKIKIQDPSTMLGLAVLFLKRMDTASAVDYYLDVQELEPNNRIAKRALSVIRKHSNQEDLSDWLGSEKLDKLFPPIPFGGFTFKTIVTAVSSLVVFLFLLFGLLINIRVIQNPFTPSSTRVVSGFTLTRQERSAAAAAAGPLTRQQILSLYDRALSLFTSYRDEAAKINLNRILASNASEEIKNKARLLISFMEVPGFDTFRREDNVTFAEVDNEPAIHRDVHVIWRGMATNLVITNEYTRFDFLIGYDIRRVLEGIVPVEFDHPVAINTERPLEVLGRINISGNGISLHGVSMHQSGLLGN